MDITFSKLFLDVNFQKSKYMISENQNISLEVDFRKSKCITENQKYYRKTTSENQNVSPKLNFRKSKN